MRPIAPALLLLAAAAASPPASAGEVEVLREDLGLLVAAAQRGVREDFDGPSPTTLVRRILGRKEKEVRALLEEAWKRSDGVERPDTDFSHGIRHVAEYLYGLERTGAAPVPKGGISFGGELGFLREEAGLVLLRPGGSGERGKVMGEKGWDRDGPEPRPALAALLKGGKWRKPPRPDAKAALALLAKDAGKDWSESERESFLLGLGEACGADAGNRPGLLRAFEEDPSNAGLARALGRTLAPEAAAVLKERIGALASRVAGGKDAALPLLQAAARGLHRIDPAAFAGVLAGMEGAEEEAVLRGIGFRAAARVLCDRHDAAPDAAGRRAAVLSMIRLVLLSGFSREFPDGEGMKRVVRAWTAALDAGDPELAEWVDRGAYGLFYMGWRDGTANMDSSTNGVTVEATGERLGPYPSAALTLRRLDEDLAAGNLSFAGREPGPFEVQGSGGGKDRERGRGEDRAWSGVRCPIPDWMEATEASPWRLSSAPAEGGLRLTLAWKGPGKAALDPVAFRYVCAEYMPVRIGGAGAARSFTYLKLEFGPLGGWASWRVPADRLRVLAPGESFTFDVAVAPEHAAAEHVSIELNDTFGLAGPCAVPPTRNLGWSWVR